MPKVVEIDITYDLSATRPTSPSSMPEGAVEGDMEIEQVVIEQQCSGKIAVEEPLSPREIMLNYIAKSKTAYFKSQQNHEPELDFGQKRKIACDVLTHSPGQFLARFGQHLQDGHLDYFTDLLTKSDDYEVAFYVKELRRFHCKAKHQMDVRNRRFEALKKLIAESSYFDELEMKKRNPLLYEDLVGQYMTQKEIEEQENSSRTKNSTLVDILLDHIEKDQMKALRKSQLDAEEGAREEFDTSSDETSDENSEEDEEHSDKEIDYKPDEKRARPEGRERDKIPSWEKDILKEEFFSHMYDSFLDGKDKDFDYSQVDLNTDYDNLTDRAQDEEEKYFDSETPDTFIPSCGNSENEDELDIFMKNLKPDPTPAELSDQLDRI